jgi:hypothetical protein
MGIRTICVSIGAMAFAMGCGGTTAAAPPTFTGEIAGTPTFVEGEGYVSMHSMRRAGGSWELVEVRGLSPEAGMVHHVEARIVTREPVVQDVGATYVEVVREVRRARGGPPVVVAAGASVAGIDVRTVGASSTPWGPFTVEHHGVTFAPFEVGGIDVGGRVVPPESSLEEVAAAFPGCTEAAVRGGRVFRCPGVTITASGDTSLPQNVRITVQGPDYRPVDPT